MIRVRAARALNWVATRLEWLAWRLERPVHDRVLRRHFPDWYK